jgi:quercetin dioxygenase-like cupin family protein
MTLKFLSRSVIQPIRGSGKILALINGGLLVGASLFNVPPVFAETAKPGMQRTPLLEQSVDLPAKQIKAKMLRVAFPPGFKSPLHTHEGPGPRYVVKGTVKVSEEGNEGTYAAGEAFWESGREMRIENIGADTAEIIVIELAPAKNNH